MKKTSQDLTVSIIIPMRNASTTVLKTLNSLRKQTYPIAEVIVLDNKSKDDSIKKVETFKKKSPFPIIIKQREEDRGVGASYNAGAKLAKSSHIVFMHSDSELSTKQELFLLIKPFLDDENVIATYSTIILPLSVWKTYNFWQKCLFARSVDTDQPGMNGKFDCIRKDIFLKIGGFNEANWGRGAGGEDADLHMKLDTLGKVILSKAKIIHLHYIGKNFSLSDWFSTKKQLARTYGRLIRVKGFTLPLGALAFGIKPTLAILPFVLPLHTTGLFILFFFALIYSRNLFTHKETALDIRILLVPFIEVALIYYETFWMIEAFLFTKK